MADAPTNRTLPFNPWISALLLGGASAGANFIGVTFNLLTNRIIFNPILAVEPGFQTFLATSQSRLVYISMVAFPLITILSVVYFWPLIRLASTSSMTNEDRARLRRRSINGPVVLALLSVLPWVFGAASTLLDRTSDHLALNAGMTFFTGIVTVIAALFLAEMVLRFYLAPRLFPDGRLSLVPGTVRVRTRTRLLLLAATICVLPVAYYHVLLYAASFQFESGVSGQAMISNLIKFSDWLAPIFILVGLGLTLALARSFSAPLSRMERATEHIEAGEFDAPIAVVSNDEIGVLGDSMNSMIAGLRDRAKILDQFGRLVDPRVRDYLLGDSTRLAGRRKQVVVFFSDIRSFTALTERIAPEQVFDLLNRHFTMMTTVITAHGGHVDKYIGDAVMAVFGLFDDRELDFHCRQALAAGRAIRAELASFNAADQANALRIGMGLHAGEVLAGKLGSEERFDYTVIGDTVNVASRIEALTKKFETDLILSDAVLQGTGEAPRETHRVQVRGRAEPITIHTI